MIIIDRALEAREAASNPIRVGMVGAGFMARGLANQIVRSTPGMSLVAIAARRPETAREAFAEAGIDDVMTAESAVALDREVGRGRAVVTEDPYALCEAGLVDVVVEVTGSIEYAVGVVLAAFERGKHVVSMNAELEGTLGSILRWEAEKAGVVYTVADGDQPGVQLSLVRFVRQIGLTPLLCGNIKGLQDPYRNPTTQEGFAKRWGQKPIMVSSFADGTKISFEQAIVANATGMTIARRGMGGYDFSGHVDEAMSLYDVDDLRAAGGIVDYLVGAKPGPGVFVYATHDDPRQRRYLELYKLGKGPLYSFYTPYHLCHFEVPITVARAVLFGDVALQAAGAPRVEVVTTAKTSLTEGTIIDGFGGYHTYGQAERADVVARGGLLPIGLAVGCRVRRPLPVDHVLTYGDVDLPSGRLTDTLRERQAKEFPVL